MGYGRLLSNKPLLVNDIMRRPFSSTSSGSHRLSNEINIDIKLYEALGKNIVFALDKIGDVTLDRVDTSGACKVRCSYSSYVYQYSVSISASILVCTITDFNFNS